MYKTADHTQC